MEHSTNRDNDFYFWKTLFLTFLFFTITPLVIFLSLFSMRSLSQTKKESDSFAKAPQQFTLSSHSGMQVYASLPDSLPSISASPETSDARGEIIKRYLNDHNSPLEPFSQEIVDISDKYGIDYRLLTAIAQQESNLCKIIPKDSYNCWGWGVHSKGTLRFSSYTEALETVSSGLKENYIDKGYTEVSDIMSKYTPLSEGSWAYGVEKFMSDMELPENF